MYYKILLCLLFLTSTQIQAFSQLGCDKFDIVSIYDIPPTPQTPGGNYFFMLLTTTEDITDLSAFYADLYFVDLNNDTTTIRFGNNQTLPINEGDTIPYLMKLSGEQSNLDFPNNFEGKLVIEAANNITCEVMYSNITSNTSNVLELGNSIHIYPNPFEDFFTIAGLNEFNAIHIYNIDGKLLESIHAPTQLIRINPDFTTSKFLFVLIEMKNGMRFMKKVVRL